MTVAGDSLHFWARPDFWYQTTFTLPAGTDPLQLHATIVKDSTQRPRDIGKVVVALVKFEGDDLTLGVVNDFESPPESPVGADWDRVMDLYHLTRARPSAEEPSAEEGG
ncbi:MAG: hypothetical protein D6696_03165 [Acidobacteria bacterium]|nr:MAG: hypothetical protein D6696_03165 [Acidobacteriota bacterium]